MGFRKLQVPDKEAFVKDVEIHPNSVLAEKYGVSLHTITKWRKRFGLANVWKKEMVDWGCFDRDSIQMRWHEVCKKHGVSHSVMKNWKRERGLTDGKKRDRKIAWAVDGNGCWVCTSHKPNVWGYPQGSSKRGRRMIAKVVWSESNGVWPDGLSVLHSCDNKLCVNPDHVRPGTAAENSHEMDVRNRSPWGERNGVRRLTPLQAREIFELKCTGASQREVGKRFGVSGATVFRIWSGDSWRRDNEGIENFKVKLTRTLPGKKLSLTEVESIKSMKGKMSTRKAAAAYRISQRMVVKIWNGESWKILGGGVIE